MDLMEEVGVGGRGEREAIRDRRSLAEVVKRVVEVMRRSAGPGEEGDGPLRVSRLFEIEDRLVVLLDAQPRSDGLDGKAVAFARVERERALVDLVVHAPVQEDQR